LRIATAKITPFLIFAKFAKEMFGK